MLQLDPSERVNPLIRALIDAYRRSRNGRTGNGSREFNIRYDKLVHDRAQATVVDEKRGRAALDRLRAAGIIRWDHTPLQRDKIKTIYIALSSEKELFTAVGEAPPANQRSDAVAILAKHLDALSGHTYESAWRVALQQAMDDLGKGRAAEGLPVESHLHDEILRATAAVLCNREPILIRRLSAEKLRNSKLLKLRQDGVERFMAQFLPPDLTTLEAWQVADTPPAVLVRGPLGIECDDGSMIDQRGGVSPYTVAEEILAHARRFSTGAKHCLSIENLTTFRETVELGSSDLLVHTSYPSSAVVKLLRALPAGVVLQHWGDTDPWGYDILRVLREKTGRKIAAWRMTYRPWTGSDPSPKLSKREISILDRLIADPLMSDVRPELLAMKKEGNKGFFEQESLPRLPLSL